MSPTTKRPVRGTGAQRHPARIRCADGAVGDGHVLEQRDRATAQQGADQHADALTGFGQLLGRFLRRDRPRHVDIDFNAGKHWKNKQDADAAD